MIEINSPVFGMVCCIVAYLGIMAPFVILGTRSKLKFAARLRRGLRNGDYDEQKHPRRARHMRMFVLVASSLAMVSFLVVVIVLSSYAFPDLLVKTIGLDRFRTAIAAWFLFSFIAVIVLSFVFNRTMGDGYE